MKGENLMSQAELQACIDACLSCYRTCLSTAMHHCLEMGGEHVAKPHFTLMMSCAEICRTAAHFMLLGSSHHAHICAECAEICDQCAKDCRRLEGMEACAEACERCAASCRDMAIPLGA